MKHSKILLVIALLCLAGTAGAEVYRWTDKSGKVHYSDTPPTETEAQTRRLYDSSIEQEKLPYETRQAASRFPLVLLTGEACGEPCKLARDYLGKRKAPFSEKLLKTQEEIDAYKRQLGKAELSVPTLLVGSRVLDGFEPGAWGNELNLAGYPK